MNNDKMVTFFYILMRDELPVGKVIDIIENYVPKTEIPEFTNKDLENLARDLVARLNR